MKRILILLTLILSACQAEQLPSVNNINGESLIGSWVEVENDPCWSTTVKYFANGLKQVETEFCNEKGIMEKGWYKAKWSIEGNKLKEDTFEVSSGFFAEVIKLPHIEVDTVEILTNDKLVLVQPLYDNEKAIYKKLE
tara:strand:- start:1875 stop:2288 length:414 start_codon:yes stop_codon:yes gene_type:complete